MDAVQAGEYEVLADETSVQLKAKLSAPSRPSTHNLPATKPRKTIVPWS
ncbi:hypothetical protein QFZ23_002367 [Arthrobacter globiformis]|nr:hypothetical protein [Arthrobacter globiformis]